MPMASLELEYLGRGGFEGRIFGPRGGHEFKTDDLDKALTEIRTHFLRLCTPLQPSPEPERVELPAAPPRFVRHAKKDDAPPPVEAANDGVSAAEPRKILSRSEVAKMRTAADAAAAGSAEEAAARKAAFAARKL